MLYFSNQRGNNMTHNEFDENVGRNLKALREKKRMTQQELATKLGVTRATVCRWELGTRSLYFSTSKDICKVLECELEDLVK